MTPTEYLFSLERHGVKLGLDNIRALLSAAGDPQLRVPVIHIAGTNGKGSVAAILDAILQAAGLRTGRYTSPHLIRLNERFLINRQPISGEDLDRHIEVFRRIASGWPTPPTFFEVATAAAFSYFAGGALDAAVLEVGMGGRFDATNVVCPMLTAVTTIDLEHTRYLGDTLEAIAFEKAGIIKPGVPAVTGETKPGPLGVIEKAAAERSSPLTRIGRDFQATLSGEPLDQRISYQGPSLRLQEVPFGLPGRFQEGNAAVAIRLAELMMEQRAGVTREAIAAGLVQCRWPCRLERILEKPPVYIDVAHNPAGSAALARDIPPALVVLAVANDKDAARMLDALEPKTEGLILTQFTGPRSMPVDELAQAAGERPARIAPTLEEALALGMAEAQGGLPLLITGSIFTAGEARSILTARYGAPPLRF